MPRGTSVGDLRFLSCFLFPSVSSWMVPLAWYVVMVRFSALCGSLNAARAAVCVDFTTLQSGSGMYLILFQGY
jgi:hypothetical protein